MAILFIIVFVVVLAWKIWSSSPKAIGNFGERHVAGELAWLPKEYYTLNDILLPNQSGTIQTTQIDHIVVSPYGIFIIETKNYKGWISGHENSEKWKQSLFGKKGLWGRTTKQHKLQNPIRQNIAHTIAIKNILREIGNFRIIPIVVFSDNAKLNITTPNNIVIPWSSLRSTIKSFSEPCISQEDIAQILSKLSQSAITEERSRENHTLNIQAVQQNREATIAAGICPKCGGYLVAREGKYGHFIGCSRYPRCRFTKDS